MDRRLKPRHLLLVPVLIALLLAPAAARADSPGFKFGVSSGDVHAHSAILWARALNQGPAVLQVKRANVGSPGGTPPGTAGVSTGDWVRPCPATPEAFRNALQNLTGDDQLRHRQVSLENNYTVQATVGGLESGVKYIYRWCMTSGRHSVVGHFETPPAADQVETIRFSLSGDQDAENQPGDIGPFWNRFEVLKQIISEGNDFNILMGDTIYSDSEVPGINRNAWTVGQKWRKYQINLARWPFHRVRGATSYFAHWDDHEFINDFSPFENGVIADEQRSGDDPAEIPANVRELYGRGVRAFRDYNPIAWNSQDGIYRTVRWGKNVELFFLDERSFRSAKASANHHCDNPETGEPDLAPTAEGTIARTQFGLLIPSLQQPVSQECKDELNDPDRTMLGQRQLRRFKRAIDRSDAIFKVIVNEVPIQQFYAFPYDRWEGYVHERLALIRYLRDNVENAVFLTTDVHANLVNDVRLKTVEEGGPVNSGIIEATNGPIATASYETEIDDMVGQQGTGAAVYSTVLKPPPPQGVGMQCAAIDIFSYAEIAVSQGQLRIDLKDQDGNPVREGTDGSGPPCAPVIIPAQ